MAAPQESRSARLGINGLWHCRHYLRVDILENPNRRTESTFSRSPSTVGKKAYLDRCRLVGRKRGRRPIHHDEHESGKHRTGRLWIDSGVVDQHPFVHISHTCFGAVALANPNEAVSLVASQLEGISTPFLPGRCCLFGAIHRLALVALCHAKRRRTGRTVRFEI